MDEAKTRVLTAALSLFAADGYNSTGVQRICDESGVTKPTLYYHFGNKRGLLDAVLAVHYSAFLQELESAGTYRGDVAAGLTGSLSVFLRYARERSGFMRLRLALSFGPPSSEEHEASAPYSERLHAFFRRFFCAAAGDHGNMSGREVQYAASFIGTADAYAGLCLSGSDVLDDQSSRRVIHYFMHGIFS